MTNKSSKISVIFILVLCFALCISFAELFSSLIAVGGFSAISNSDIKQNEFCVYAVYAYKTETKATALNMSEIVMKKNGAGFIEQDDNAYYVYLAAYENENDAKKVQENLKDSEQTSEIKKISFPEISFKAQTSSQEKTALNSAVCSYLNMYKKLYDLSVSVDTNLYTELEAKNLLKDIVNEFEKIKSNFENNFNSKLTSSILSLKLSLNNVSEILKNLSEYSSTTIPYSAKIKNCYFEILFEYLNLKNNI